MFIKIVLCKFDLWAKIADWVFKGWRQHPDTRSLIKTNEFGNEKSSNFYIK